MSQKPMLLQKLLLQHQKAKDLTVFARAARQRGFTETLSDALTWQEELHNKNAIASTMFSFFCSFITLWF